MFNYFLCNYVLNLVFSKTYMVPKSSPGGLHIMLIYPDFIYPKYEL